MFCIRKKTCRVEVWMCVEDDDSFSAEVKVTRRLLSRLCAQSYDRLGIFTSCISTELKILTSWSCELASISELDLDLDLKDPDFVQVARKILRNLKQFYLYLKGYAEMQKKL